MSGGAAGPAKLQHAIRSKAGVQTFWGTSEVVKADGFASPENARTLEYSKDGNLLAVIAPDNVLIFNTQNGNVATTIARPNVVAVAFSPQNNFLVTWERLEEKVNNKADNLIVWRLETAEPIIKFTHNVFASDLWPVLTWTKDEVYFARVVKNEVLFYVARSPRASEPVRKLLLNNVVRVEFAPTANTPYYLAAFVPEGGKNSTPGFVKIFAVPSQGADIRATASKSFFRGTSANLMWNSTGTALLASLSTDVDATGRSYYGETGLYFLTTDASFECMIQLQKEGPIHDVSWSPSGKEFVVTFGFMPNPQTTLFDAKCNPTIDFGTASRNTIRWSPNGKLLCIGGFGNLTGQMDFYDVKAEKKVGSAIAHCAAICEWAPDSRHFIAAVVSPRIRVDNGYKIFKADGTLVYEAAGIPELYQVAWRPRPASAYPDRPLTPPKAGSSTPASSLSPVQPKPAAAAPAKYRHPNAIAAASFAPKEEEGVKRYKAPGVAVPEKNLPPGWFDDEDDKKKKKKKNKKKKGSKEEDGADFENDKEITQGVGALSVDSPTTTRTTTTTTTTSSPTITQSLPPDSPVSPSLQYQQQEQQRLQQEQQVQQAQAQQKQQQQQQKPRSPKPRNNSNNNINRAPNKK